MIWKQYRNSPHFSIFCRTPLDTLIEMIATAAVLHKDIDNPGQTSFGIAGNDNS